MMTDFWDFDPTDAPEPNGDFSNLPEISLPIEPDTPLAAMWRKVDIFDFEDAARLWAGVDPGKPLVDWTTEERSKVAAARACIKSSIFSGKVELDQPTVSQRGLQLLGISMGIVPTFIFDPDSDFVRIFDPSLVRYHIIKPIPILPELKPQKTNRGRKPVYDWPAAELEMGNYIKKYGFPERQADMVRHISDWFSQQHNQHPAQSTLQLNVSKFIKQIPLPDNSQQ